MSERRETVSEVRRGLSHANECRSMESECPDAMESSEYNTVFVVSIAPFNVQHIRPFCAEQILQQEQMIKEQGLQIKEQGLQIKEQGLENRELRKEIQELRDAGFTKPCTLPDGTVRPDGDWWQSPSCKNCTCSRGQVRCQNVTCPVISCKNPVQIPGQCCPVCKRECLERMRRCRTNDANCRRPLSLSLSLCSIFHNRKMLQQWHRIRAPRVAPHQLFDVHVQRFGDVMQARRMPEAYLRQSDKPDRIVLSDMRR